MPQSKSANESQIFHILEIIVDERTTDVSSLHFVNSKLENQHK